MSAAPQHRPVYGPSRFAYIERYWSDLRFAIAEDAERDRQRAEWHAAMDRYLAPARAAQAARWAREEAEGEAIVAALNREGGQHGRA